jgi:Rod binding domain-containing protein
MPDSSAFGAVTQPLVSPLSAQADRLLKTASSTDEGDKKIEKSSRDFESLLLGTWLQQAEESFASLPGGDDDDDADAGKSQFQGIAMQSLASSMTADGGIGIAKMIAANLHKAEDARLAKAAAANTTEGGG